MAKLFEELKPPLHPDPETEARAEAAYEAENADASIDVEKPASLDEVFCAPTAAVIGLTAVHCTTPVVMSQFKRAFEHAICHGNSKIGLSFPNVSLIKSLVTVNSRQAAILAEMHKVDSTKPQVTLETVVIGKAPIDWLSDAGFCALRPYINGSCQVVICEQQLMPVPMTPVMTEILLRICAEANANNLYVIMLFSFSGKADYVGLKDRVDDFVIVEDCEPYGGDSFAFSIDYPSLHDQFGERMVKKMCSARVENGRHSYSYEPFDLKGLTTRLMLNMKRQGATFREIADRFGGDHTTVFRQLQTLKVDVKAKSCMTPKFLKRQIQLLLCSADDDDIGGLLG